METDTILNVSERLRDAILDGTLTTWGSNADVPIGGYFQLDCGKDFVGYLRVTDRKETYSKTGEVLPNLWYYTFVVERTAEDEALLVERLKKLGYVE